MIGTIGRRGLLGAGLAAGAALALGAPALAQRGRTVVATTPHVADLVRNVAGGRLEVVGLLGEGVDPHTYRLTRSDTARLASAAAVFYNGLLLEGRMVDALVRIAARGVPVHAVADMLPEDRLLEPEEFEGQADPHVWMDVSLWALAVDGVCERLEAVDPDGADAFRAEAARYAAVLARLDAYAREVLSAVPEGARVLVTAHDAFNYLGAAYGLEVMGVQGISTESEAGLRRIQEMVDLLVERRIRAVFVETSVTDRNVRALVEGAAARGHRVEVGGELFSDSMGPPGTYEGTYVGMIDHNVTTIARALGSPAPAGGFQGLLAARR